MEIVLAEAFFDFGLLILSVRIPETYSASTSLSDVPSGRVQDFVKDE